MSSTKSNGRNGAGSKRAARPPARGGRAGAEPVKDFRHPHAGGPERLLIRWREETPGYGYRNPRFQVHDDYAFNHVEFSDGWEKELRDITQWTRKEVRLARVALESHFDISVPCPSATVAVRAVPMLLSMIGGYYRAEFDDGQQCIVLMNARVTEEKLDALREPFVDPKSPMGDDDEPG